MAKFRGYRVLSGSYAEVWIGGDLIAEAKKIELKISYEREDIQVGIDMDSKFKNQKGEWTLELNKVYSRFEDYRQKFNAGKDERLQIITKLKDPDATGGQTERYSVDNCWLNELPAVSYEVGAPVTQEISGGFTPSDMINLDKVGA